MRRFALAGILAAAVVIAAVLWLWPDSTSPPEPSAHAHPTATSVAGPSSERTCVSVDAPASSYTVTEVNDLRLQLGPDALAALGAGSLPSAHVETNWQARIGALARESADSVIVQVSFESVETSLPLAAFQRDALLESPLLVRLSPRCDVLEFGWPEETPSQLVYLQQALFARLQAPGPPSDSTTHYRATVFDATGQFDVEGEAVEGALVLEYERQTNSWEGEPNRYVDVIDSRIRAERSDNLALFSSLESRLELRHRDGQTAVATSETEVRAQRLMADVTLPQVQPVGDSSWVWGNLLQLGPSAAPQAEAVPDVDPRMVGVSADEALVRYAELVETDATPSEYLAFLRAWIRANPDQMDQLLELMRGEFFIGLDAARSGVFEALAQVGSPEATALLLTMLRSDDVFSGDRVRAAFALNGMKPAPDGLLDDILATLDGSMNPLGEDAMLLQAGVFAHAQQEYAPEDAARAREWIQERFDTSGPDDIGPLLQAAGNATGDEFVDMFATGLAHPDPAVRVIAARATRGLSAELQVAQVLSSLETETNANVRATLFEAARLSHAADAAPLPGNLVEAAMSGLDEVQSAPEYRSRVDALGYATE
ncbi:MAG: hypothetical protein KC561_06450, partial [Myxococcales bacterium]|nr:hypothetical protein [Myxococcales bacterium]